MIKNIYNLGDAALYCDFGDTVNKETNLKVINYFNDIREKNITGIKNIAPSYNKLIIYFDLELTNYKKIKDTVENLDISNFEYSFFEISKNSTSSPGSINVNLVGSLVKTFLGELPIIFHPPGLSKV